MFIYIAIFQQQGIKCLVISSSEAFRVSGVKDLVLRALMESESPENYRTACNSLTQYEKSLRWKKLNIGPLNIPLYMEMGAITLKISPEIPLS